MIRRNGRYFDGTTSRAVDVELTLYADGTLMLAGPGVSLNLRRDAIRVSPRLGNTLRVLALPGGARCELADDEELERALAGTAGRDGPRWLDTFERRTRMAALAVLLTVLALAAALQLGIPALAGMAADSLPAGADAQLGEGALAALDEAFFGASALPAERRDEIQALFSRLAQGGDSRAQLVLRSGGHAGANAFALPGGVVVLTDEMAQLAARDEEIAAVLAHELGHVARRHALRSVLQNAGVGLLVAAALGDLASISSLAATLPTLLVQLQYSRRFEREADAYAVALLARHGIEADALAAILERLEQETPGQGLPAYLSTHPDTAERVRAIRQARPQAARSEPQASEAQRIDPVGEVSGLAGAARPA